MKKDLHSILDELTPEELDTLPEELFQAEALDDMTFRRIQNAVAEQTGLSVKSTDTHTTHASKKLWRTFAAAACIILLLGVGVGSYTYAADKKEYKNALEFFYEHDLSTNGLTQNEIKEVYRDFYTYSFSDDLTTKVLLNSRQDLIPGYEITSDVAEQEDPLPTTSVSNCRTPIYYEYDSVFVPVEGEEYNEFVNCTFAKYKDGEKLWEVSFDDFSIEGYYGDTEFDGDPVLVYGREMSDSTDGYDVAKLVALAPDGTILWKVVQDNTSSFDQILEVLIAPDGSYIAFGRSGHTNLCINKYTKDGVPIYTAVHEVGDHKIANVTPSETGYLIQLFSYVTLEYSRVIKVDFEGNLLGDFRYDSEECDFYISDLCEHNGTVYISGYSTPKAPDYKDFYKRNILVLRETLWEAEDSEEGLSDEERTALFRENFTAVLLACEPNSGTPKEFYSVKGSLGDEVYVNNGSVCWFTKDIIASSYAPQVTELIGNVYHVVSGSRYSATCQFYANIFNKDGTFKERKQLDLMTELRWGNWD